MNWYEREYIFNPLRNKFIPFCWERQKDDVYCLWQYGENTHKKFLKYLNGNEKRIQWTQEIEKDRTLHFLDMKLKIVENKIHMVELVHRCQYRENSMLSLSTEI